MLVDRTAKTWKFTIGKHGGTLGSVVDRGFTETLICGMVFGDD